MLFVLPNSPHPRKETAAPPLPRDLSSLSLQLAERDPPLLGGGFSYCCGHLWTLCVVPNIACLEAKASHQECLVCCQSSCISRSICLFILVSLVGVRTELEFK